MKTTTVARGFLGTVASLLGVVAVGCSAGMMDEGAAGEGEIRSVEQAIALSPGLNPGSTDLQFGGFHKIAGTNKTVWLGGYDRVTGAGSRLAAIFDPTLASAPTDLRWLELKLANNDPALIPNTDGLGEMEIAELARELDENEDIVSVTLLVAGGREDRDDPAVTDTYILTLSGTNLQTASWVTPTDQLSVGRVIGLNNLQKCGDKWIAIGGMTNKGMENLANITATNTIEVFTYNAGTPANSTWDALVQNVSGTDREVKLRVDRGYHEVLHVSDTEFVIAGGANANASLALASAPLGGASKNVEKLSVDGSCKATNADDIDASGAFDMRTDFAATSLPAPRARMASIQKAVTVNSVVYDFAIEGGNTNASGPYTAHTDAILYDVGTDAWIATCAGTVQGRVFPRAINNTATSNAQWVTGVLPQTGLGNNDMFFNTTAVVSTLSAAGACSTATALTDSRVGSLAVDVGGGFVGLGTKYVNNVLSQPANVFESF